MASYTKQSRLIFVDSDANVPGNRSKCRIQFPQHPFSACCGDKIRLTLVSFQCPRAWFAVNQYNCRFHLYKPAPADDYDEFVIAHGDYSLAELAVAVAAALDAVYTTSTCTVTGTTTKRLVMTIVGAPADSFLVMWATPPGLAATLPNSGVTREGFHQDTYKLLGGIPSRTGTPVNAQGSRVGAATQTMPLAATLATIASIDIRTSVNPGNFTTPHESTHKPGHSLVESNVLARIPLGPLDANHPFVMYQDSNDTYSTVLDRKNLDFLELSLTDTLGRELPQQFASQQALGLQGFQACLRFDQITSPPPMPYVPFVDDSASRHVPNL